jgi:hypothetical protein
MEINLRRIGRKSHSVKLGKTLVWTVNHFPYTAY